MSVGKDIIKRKYKNNRDKFLQFKLNAQKLIMNKSARLIDLSSDEALERKPYNKRAYPFGVNLFGYLKDDGMRQLADMLVLSEIKFRIIPLSDGNYEHKYNSKLKRKFSNKPRYSINIFHINPAELSYINTLFSKKIWEKRYNISFWLYNNEKNNINAVNAELSNIIDEVWTPSEYSQKLFENKLCVPVFNMPYGLEAMCKDKYDRAYFGLPSEKFLFLIMSDTSSSILKSNIDGAIKAYKKAFQKEDLSVGLIIRTDVHINNILNVIMSELNDYKNIYLLEKKLSDVEENSLINICNVFVSLHRSADFGFRIAKAMLVKTPVIATNVLTNKDLMTVETACCVDCETENTKMKYCSETGDVFFDEPDLIQASVFMKILKSDSHYRRQLAENAYSFVNKKYALMNTVNKISKKLYEINRK